MNQKKAKLLRRINNVSPDFKDADNRKVYQSAKALYKQGKNIELNGFNVRNFRDK